MGHLALTSCLSGAAPVLASSADGRMALSARDGLVQLTTGDGRGAASRRALLCSDGVVAAAVVQAAAWLVTEERGGHTLHRFGADGAPVGPGTWLGELGAGVKMAVTRVAAPLALIEGRRGVLVRDHGAAVTVEDLGPTGRDRRVLLAGRGVVERRGRHLAFRRQGALAALSLPPDADAATVISGALVFDGAAAIVEVDHGGKRTLLVFELQSGTVRSRIRLGEAAVLAVAERKGMLVLGRGAHLALLDLRGGRCVGERIFAGPIQAAAIDAGGTNLRVLDDGGRVLELERSLGNRVDVAEPEPAATSEPASESASGAELERGAGASFAAEREPGPEREPVSAFDSEPATDSEPGAARARGAGASFEPAPDATSAAAAEPALDAAGPRADAACAPRGPALPLLPLLALRPARAFAPLSSEALSAFLDDTRAWIGALCRTALAVAWDTGRIARADPAAHPFAGELEAIVASSSGRAAAALAEARRSERDADQRLARWSRPGAPHLAVAEELGLSPLATTVLLLAAAPQIWGELARGYGLIANDPGRPLVDELLLAHLIEADQVTRHGIARELDADAPLCRTGAIEVGAGLRPYAALTVHPAIVRRLAGAQVAPGADHERHAADRSLDEIIGPRAELAALARALAAPTAAPPRVVLRGRLGAGRRTIAAALAAQAGRKLGVVVVEAGSAGGVDVVALLRRRLRDVALRGDLPCVSLDELSEDPALRSRLRAALDQHPGPLMLRAPIEGDLPLAPGYHEVALKALTETERTMAWRRVLREHALPTEPAAGLAARFSVGVGAMVQAVSQVAGAQPTEPKVALEVALARALRQHRSARIGSIATRVTRLASWEELVVPDDIGDALRELVARVRCRRTVLEDWGMDQVAATAQGVTALFQGGAGTGKTMAAGVIAAALGYELWRVDLSKVVSKWIGETEKNLAAVFEAAEDGEIVLLFDEADSLFGKRTEVKSSHDRNANLETNYLLQRLDTFTGVAILTTNFGTAIDAAFKRRLSVHVQFPFPDEVERERLWRAHLPPRLPTSGALDLAALAHKYQLSGGYIRNAALRAAYLAAASARPLTHDSLERAVQSVYRDQAKVGTSGRLE